jgi:uncharacterized protein involved in type VI secretion and phage assembly
MGMTTLKIDTLLGRQEETGDKGPLLLASVQGTEGISIPYAYDVTMYRRISDGDIDPRRMIDTNVTIHMRGSTGAYTARRGVFQTFEKDGTNLQPDERQWQRFFRVFRARIVPSFKMMDFEIRYRVFEDMTVLGIMKEVMDGFSNNTNFSSYVQSLQPDNEKYPKIPYCVQFGESSMTFLSRLMSQFNIWYVFDHGQSEQMSLAAHERMVLGADPAAPIKCLDADMEIVLTGPDVDGISGFQRCFAPPRKRVWVSDFNMLDPTSTPRGSAPADPNYDMLGRENDDGSGYEREVFPAQWNKPTGTADAMNSQAGDRVQDEETNAFTVQGMTKNPNFVAGRKFTIVKDDTKANILGPGVPDTGEYLITLMTFSAFENTYGHYWEHDIWFWVFSPIRWVFSIFRSNNSDQALYFDGTAALASGGLTNWVQNQALTHASDPPPSTPPNPYQMKFGDTFLAGMDSSFVSALAQLYLVNAPKEIIARHADGYSNAFIAVPWDAKTYKILPGPDGAKPRAYGPHLGVVIGPEGKKDVALGGKTDIYADGLGRVRVRFPWQRTVPMPNGLADDPEMDATDPMNSGRRACWVPVSEGWSGRGFGTQFLPRIGQEVIVSFLDGDPERPIITGRRYNADSGYSNIPFPPGQVDGEIFNNGDWDHPAPLDFRFNGLKTASTPNTGGGKSRYHLMRFDDTYNCEQLLLRSQGRLDVTAFAHSFETTYGDKNVTAVQGTDKDGNKFGGNIYTTVGADYQLHVGANRYEQVDKDYELTVKGDVRLDLEKGLTAVVKGDVSIGLNSLTIEATEKITLKVGSSFIVIDHCAVYINGPSMIYENSGGSPDSAASATLKNVANATLAEPGDKWNARLTECGAGGSGGGGHGVGGGPPTHTASPTPAPTCDAVVNGVSCDFLSGGNSP